MGKAHPISSYRFKASDNYFFDANVWLVIDGPQGNPKDAKTIAYSSALKEILRLNAPISIDVLVLSEFINRYARIRYTSSKSSIDFKQFRNSPAFKPIALEISSAARRIIAMSRRVESLFHSVDIQKVLADYEKGDSDFNDTIIGELCKSNGMILVTHDADFKASGLTILTANRKLI